MRISHLLLAAVALLAGADALALGLGGLRTQSSLNAPFYGEIDLIGVNRDELDAVTARLASDDEFEKAGIDRPHFLTRLRFETMLGTSGRPIIQVTSREPIREPYMDFLVEVIWSEGTLVKEYAVLLDPPGTTGRPAPAIAAPVATAPPTEAGGVPDRSAAPVGSASSPNQASAGSPAAAASQPSPESPGDELVARAPDAAVSDVGDDAGTAPSGDMETRSGPEASSSETAGPEATPTDSSQPLARGQPPDSSAGAALKSPPPAPAAVASASSDRTQYPLRYGPVQRGDGLVRIARELAPSGATVEQTVMALFRNNQDAFIAEDINKLIVGPTMVIPSKAELFALDPDEAKREFTRALAGGTVRTSPIAPVKDPDAEIASETPEAARLKIVGSPGAPTPDSADESSDTDGSAAAADAEEPAVEAESPLIAATRRVAGLQQDVLLVRETSEANREETRELRERIAGLEEQLEDIKRLLEVQAEIARLQLEGTRAQMLQRQADGADVAEAGATSSAARDGQGPASQEAAALSTARGATGSASGSPSPDVTAEASADAADDRFAAAQGLVASVLNEIPLKPVLIGGGLLVAGGLGTMLWSRRRRSAPTSTDDDPSVESISAAQPPPEPTQANLAALEDRPAATPSSEPPSAPVEQSARPAAAASDGSGTPPNATAPARRMPSIESDEPAPTTTAPGPITTAESGLADDRKTWVPETETGEASTEAATSLGSDPAADEPSDNDAQTVFAASDGGNVVVGQAETQDADVISEADIFILYGRYREAESLLRDALCVDPTRVDVKFKLAEAYVAGEDRDALASLVEEMRGAGEDAYDPSRWSEIQDALEGMPASERSAPQPSSPKPSRASHVAESVGRADEVPWPEETAEVSASGAFGRAAEADAVSDDSAGPVERPDRYGSRPELVDETQLELDDPDQLGFGEESSPADRGRRDSAVGVNRGAAEVDELDLELVGLEGIEELLDAPPGSPGGDGDKQRAQTSAPTPFGASASAEVAGHQLGDELESHLEDPLLSSRSDDVGHESSQWHAESGLWDEVGTKMDLARAYIEMDDADAARTILEEVILEGTDEQGAAARKMLKELG